MIKRKRKEWMLYAVLVGICGCIIVLFACMMPKYPTYKKTQLSEVSTSNESDAPTFEGDDVPFVVIDPGHGGYDEGSRSESGIIEKDIDLEISLKVKERLEKEGVKVLMTRSDDTVSWPSNNAKDLQARLDIASEAQADLMVSLHCNISNEDPENVRGSEVYANSKQKESTALAQSIVNVLDTLDDELPSRGVKLGSLHLLTYNTIPTVVVEMGFLSNENDVRYLTTDITQDKMCDGIVKGIIDYLKKN